MAFGQDYFWIRFAGLSHGRPPPFEVKSLWLNGFSLRGNTFHDLMKIVFDGQMARKEKPFRKPFKTLSVFHISHLLLRKYYNFFNSDVAKILFLSLFISFYSNILFIENTDRCTIAAISFAKTLISFIKISKLSYSCWREETPNACNVVSSSLLTSKIFWSNHVQGVICSSIVLLLIKI